MEKDSFDNTGFSKMKKKPASRAGDRVQCIRCHSEINSYIFTRLTFHPYGSAGGNVVLECAKCGHIELMSQTSPLLRGLTAKPVAVGDGD
ncbi:MAG: hypothetical protein WBV55_02660 [Candidatus Sulfotelmatobacter sp.]